MSNVAQSCSCKQIFPSSWWKIQNMYIQKKNATCCNVQFLSSLWVYLPLFLMTFMACLQVDNPRIFIWMTISGKHGGFPPKKTGEETSILQCLMGIFGGLLSELKHSLELLIFPGHFLGLFELFTRSGLNTLMGINICDFHNFLWALDAFWDISI